MEVRMGRGGESKNRPKREGPLCGFFTGEEVEVARIIASLPQLIKAKSEFSADFAASDSGCGRRGGRRSRFPSLLRLRLRRAFRPARRLRRLLWRSNWNFTVRSGSFAETSLSRGYWGGAEGFRGLWTITLHDKITVGQEQQTESDLTLMQKKKERDIYTWQ
ncbi:hypothetical protein DM860_006811 [Cuscuta australis]|uniref:Uncharacterized protein n=1 Tax=Cuscuta australis TaxID=267555 RepID=A0A328E954_9ASTE|nr:hypothetical protein DM860_006811 [Cuscuta australis]